MEIRAAAICGPQYILLSRTEIRHPSGKVLSCGAW